MITKAEKETLDQVNDILTRESFTRKVSQVETAECPVYNPYEGLWLESDDEFRNRIKTALQDGLTSV